MASAGRPRGFSSDPPIGSGRDRGSPHYYEMVYQHKRFGGEFHVVT